LSVAVGAMKVPLPWLVASEATAVVVPRTGPSIALQERRKSRKRVEERVEERGREREKEGEREKEWKRERERERESQRESGGGEEQLGSNLISDFIACRLA
jgi:hypothetical protein